MSKLPDILSELIMVAVGDVKRLPDSIRMDMRWWAVHKKGKICSVCLAGAVMLESLGDTSGFVNIPIESEPKIYALNGIRDLSLTEALTDLEQSYSKEVVISFYDWVDREGLKPLKGAVSREETISTMTKVSNWLKERGL